MVEVTRGEEVESRHRGIAAIVDANGNLVAGWGEVRRPIFPRSAVKPLQALPLIETGAADALRLSETEIAAACASHRGMPLHTETVSGLLERLGLSADDLVCGAATPDDGETARALAAAGNQPSRIHNNCSGKHTGFLATAVHLGEQPGEYHLAASALQTRVRTTLSEIGNIDIGADQFGVDGCGVPNFMLPLRSVAHAMARMAAPASLTGKRAQAADRLYAAMAGNPEMIRGGRSFDTLAIAAGKGSFVTKTGAEGVHVAMLKDRGLGIALKIEDGGRRAADIAIAQLLKAVGGLGDDAEIALGHYLGRPVTNTRGDNIGEIRAAANWLAELVRI